MNLTSLTTLWQIIEQLYKEPYGCVWAKQQNFNSLAKYIIEEAQEVVEAVDSGDIEGLKDELGDLLLQILLYSFIAQKEDKFNFADIIQNLSDKLIRRCPHIFDKHIAKQYQLAENKPEFANQQWQIAKAKEKI